MKLSTNWSWVMVALLAFVTSFSMACSSPPSNTDPSVPDTGSNCSSPGALSKEDCLKDSGAPIDSGKPDSGTDTFVPDSSPPDTSVDSSMDTGSVDSGSPETAPDSSPVDSTVDSTLPDTTPVDTGVGDTGVDTSVVDSGSADTGSDTGTPDTGVKDTGPETGPTTFGCTGWTRDTKFDALKIDGMNIELAQGVKGFGSSKLFVSAGTYSKGVIAFWNGSVWTQQDLSPTPSIVYNLDGTSETDLWVAGRDSGQGHLYHRGIDAIWREDLSEPYAKAFSDVYAASSTDVFLLGIKSGTNRVWQKTGATWTEMTLPPLLGDTYAALVHLWGLDAKNVFVTGYYHSTGTPTKAILLHYNGTTWTEVSIPSDAREFSGIHGSSTDGLYVAGGNLSGQGAIYRLMTGMSSVSSVVASPELVGYGAIWSPWPGALLSSGASTTGSTFAQLTTTAPPTTGFVDGKAYGITSFWPEAGTNKVHFVNVAPPSGGTAGHYIGTCK